MASALARLRRERAVFAAERAGVLRSADAPADASADAALLAAFGEPAAEAPWRGTGVARADEALPKRSRVSVQEAPRAGRGPTPPRRVSSALLAPLPAKPPAQSPAPLRQNHRPLT